MKLKTFIASVEQQPIVNTRRQPLYMIFAQSVDSSRRLAYEAKQMERLINLSNASAEEYDMIASFRDVINVHGASESLMSCINEDDQLARCLGIAIPEVTAVNAQAVGISCCEAIEEKLNCSCGLTCKFMNDLVASVNSFVAALTDNAVCQKETLSTVYEEIVKKVSCVNSFEFSKEEICGFAQPVFMERVAAINEILNGMLNCNDESCAQQFMPALRKLGFVVEPNAVIRQETPAEAKSTEPAKEEVMNAPVEAAEQSEEELVPATPEENVAAVPAPATGSATDDVQVKEIAVLRWTPMSISEACKAVIDLLGRTSDLTKLGEKVTSICSAAVAKCDAEGEKSPEVQAKLDADRKFASFLSSALHLLGSAINGLVDQCICMSTKLKKCESTDACTTETSVPAVAITAEKPLADKCSKKGNRFAKKLVDENIKPEVHGTDPSMTIQEQPKPTGDVDPAVKPAESGDSQKEVKQTVPPDESMTVPEQPKPSEGVGAAKPVPGPATGTIEPKLEVPAPKTDDGGLVEDPILAPTTAPVTPVNDPAPTPVPAVPAAPAEPVAPVVAPVPPVPAPGTVADPIVAPVQKPEAPAAPTVPLTSDNGNPPAESGDSQPQVKQENAPDKSMTVPEQPKPEGGVQPAAAPAESGDAQKEVTQPEKVETEQNPKVEEKPAEKVEPLQNPDEIKQKVDAAKSRGVFWI